jgi:putative Ca2+/H+ antiporter (TMEM165/GDT1 family)
MKRLLAAPPFFFTTATLFAQRMSPTPDVTSSPVDSAAAAAAAAGIFGVWGVCCIFQVLFIGAALAGWIVAALWVMNDAKSRNSENAQLVTVLTWIPPTWVLGLIIHLATRPKGNLVTCPHCQKKRLEGLAVCPHCGQP